MTTTQTAARKLTAAQRRALAHFAIESMEERNASPNRPTPSTTAALRRAGLLNDNLRPTEAGRAALAR